MNDGCMLGAYRVNVIAYADDNLLLSNNEKTLNKFLKFLIKVGKLKLTINENKSNLKFFCQ